MIEVEYTNIQSATKINGILSDSFTIIFSQGCPLSYYYITVTEVLAIFIDSDTRVKGVQIADHEMKQNILLMAPSFLLRDITCITQ